MELTFLCPVHARPGPCACACPDTSRDIPDPEAVIGLRRRHLRGDPAGQEADATTVAVVAGVAGTDREVSGRHGQTIFASHGRLVLVEELPDPQAHDATRSSASADVMPLAVQHAPGIPYAAATVYRVIVEQEALPLEDGVGMLLRHIGPGGARVTPRRPAGVATVGLVPCREELVRYV